MAQRLLAELPEAPPPGTALARLREARLHLIGAEEALRALSGGSALDVRWGFLRRLHDLGYDDRVEAEIIQLREELASARRYCGDADKAIDRQAAEIARLRERLKLAEAVCHAVWNHEQAADPLMSEACIGAAAQA